MGFAVASEPLCKLAAFFFLSHEYILHMCCLDCKSVTLFFMLSILARVQRKSRLYCSDLNLVKKENIVCLNSLEFEHSSFLLYPDIF